MTTLGDKIKKLLEDFNIISSMVETLEKGGPIENIETTLVGMQLNDIEGSLKNIKEELEKEIKASKKNRPIISKFIIGFFLLTRTPREKLSGEAACTELVEVLPRKDSNLWGL